MYSTFNVMNSFAIQPQMISITFLSKPILFDRTQKNKQSTTYQLINTLKFTKRECDEIFILKKKKKSISVTT